MSQNLNLLRQKYCRPATVTGKITNCLFPLEEECEQGKALLAKAPKTLLHLQQFDPYGLQQTYRDEASGAELPVFAVFNLEGSNELRADIGMDRGPVFDASLNLANHLPFERALKFLEGVNQKALRTLSIARVWYPRVALLAAFVVALIVAAYLVPHPAARSPQGIPTPIEIFFFAFGAFIISLCTFYVVIFGIVVNLFPVKKLFLTATFDGILPKETRQKAMHARGHFDNLYLVIDQQNRWKSELLPVPASALLDPLLIGEKREMSHSSYFLIDQFDLTKAEDYLIAEFHINSEE